ncbi:dehydration-responsive element-binding protein 1E-like [Vicia villosa]|uniref:dehydration-responsive element-binding protein 1E-like n=1 Tax=Vicia villosa TaxID=3911 RepID=UPI00273ADD1C|nr:dehydration-responsive element-binding protein 1E-like [Vicia villosa]
MNIFESSFTELNYGTHQHSDTSSSSETSSSNHNNSETFLASERPKKRTGRRVFKETRHPVYRGVRKRNNNKWVCEMRVPNRNKCNNSRIWLGTYPTPEMAARAHDVAALVLKGKSACLNFADSAWRLRLPESNDGDEIRKAAMEAAELVSVEDNNQCQVGVGDGVVIEQVPTEFDDMHDLLMSIANEPLRSPSPSITDYATNWFDMEMFDTQVSSLWNFETQY